MGRWLLTKLHIDVLVELALYGPVDVVGRWEPVGLPGIPGPAKAQADALGAMLWQTNAEAASVPDEDDGDEPLPEYVFERTGAAVTAVEGLKAINCYAYQTADDELFWRRSAAGVFCQRLSGSLAGCLPGYAQAPWMWDAHDVDMRAERARASAAGDTEVPADAARVLEAFAGNGVELVPFAREDTVAEGLGRGYEVALGAKIGHWSDGVFPQPDRVHVRLYADEVAAGVGYLLRRSVDEHNTVLHLRHWVARYGRIVVDTTESEENRYPSGVAEREAAVAALGVPDEAWSNRPLPVIADAADGSVLATGITLPTGYHDGIIVGIDDAGRQRIADLIEDEAARKRILAVELDRQSVVLLVGTSHVDRVVRTREWELASPPGQDPGCLLELTLDGLRYLSAVAIAVDKLPRRPTEAWIHLWPHLRSPHVRGVYH